MSETTKPSDGLADLGYKQELKRELGAFASFASGFSFVSILTTVFELFAFGFGLGGPASAPPACLEISPASRW